MSVIVTKADGTKEPFVVAKLEQSLKRAGATNVEVGSIITKIDDILHDGIKTQEIYRLAFELLRESDAPIRARYSLRRALFGLGPTGFPFEDFLAELFEASGYTTRTRVTLKGKCVEHELDVAAFTPRHSFVAEAKFHARPGIKSDLQVVMYSFARFHDLQKTKICREDVCGIDELMVITNTKFTSTAEQYAECSGIKLLSWDYPRDSNLHDLIEKNGVYPVTVLQTLSNTQKKALIDNGIITCNRLLDKPHALRRIHVSTQRHEKIIAEAEELCGATETS